MKSTRANKKRNSKVKAQGKGRFNYAWLVRVFVLALCLSLLFGVLSELVLSSAGITFSCIIIVFLIFMNLVSDVIGVAATAADAEALKRMADKCVKGAKEAVYIIRHADKVSSICNDVIGDVCGIISGACGAAIVLKIITTASADAVQILIASLISAVIAGFTILAKAVGKTYAIKNANKIIHIVGKGICFFSKSKK